MARAVVRQRKKGKKPNEARDSFGHEIVQVNNNTPPEISDKTKRPSIAAFAHLAHDVACASSSGSLGRSDQDPACLHGCQVPSCTYPSPLRHLL